MSIHTEQYLHGNIRVGGVFDSRIDALNFKDDTHGFRTAAWWLNPVLEQQLDHPSHYNGYLPISTIRTELFGWEVLDGALSVTVEIRIPAEHPLSKTNKEEIRQVTFNVPDWKGVIREDKLIECYLQDKLDELGPESVLNVASKTFNTDSFGKVLVDNTIEIVGGGDNLGVTGAGVLKWGKVGYIEVSVPSTMHDDKTGIDYRPNLLGSTSFDGSVATRWDRTVTNVVCDNTHQWALSQSSDKTGSFKIKRTKNFSERLHDARKALGLLEQTNNEFLDIIHRWSEIPVSPKQFIKWLDMIVPIPELKETTKEMLSETGEKFTIKTTSTRGHTIALNKRELLEDMYYTDPRISPWTGTKLGVAQLGNTWAHHEQTMKGTKAFEGNVLQARVEGQMMKVLDGSFAEQDEKFLDALDSVLLKYDPEGVLIPVGSDKPVSKPRRNIKSDASNN